MNVGLSANHSISRKNFPYLKGLRLQGSIFWLGGIAPFTMGCTVFSCFPFVFLFSLPTILHRAVLQKSSHFLIRGKSQMLNRPQKNAAILIKDCNASQFLFSCGRPAPLVTYTAKRRIELSALRCIDVSVFNHEH